MNVFVWAVLLAFSSTASAYSLPDHPEKWHIVVESLKSTFEWRVDPETNKMNFRRCDTNERMELVCKRPMLSQGIQQDDLLTLIEYYLERSAKFDGRRLWQLSGTFGASIVVAGGYTTGLQTLLRMLPDKWTTLVQGTYHVATVAFITTLLYSTYTLSASRYRQQIIADQFQEALAKSPKIPPTIKVKSQALFEEFSESFRKTLHDFTHAGGLSYDSRTNLILQ